MKLKVGSSDPERDIHRANIARETAGKDVKVMLDANQQWTLPQAIFICRELKRIDPFWIEEPTHLDDILAHQTLAKTISPVKLAVGEHLNKRSGRWNTFDRVLNYSKDGAWMANAKHFSVVITRH